MLGNFIAKKLCGVYNIFMEKLKYLVSPVYNPHINLAVESGLLECADCPTLFLWKNERTVVIGANQNPYAECNVGELLSDGGALARRRTGGGAVYHDLGNLNFSFVADKHCYDVTKQLSVIQKALLPYNIEAVFSGRNDLLADGRKFSGNAFYKTDKNCLHHGTILIKTDGARLSKYLTVNPNKLIKKGVQSVVSRIVNLCELNPSIDSTNIMPELIASFESVYGAAATNMDFYALAESETVTKLYNKYSSDEYLYGDWATFSASLVLNNEWGLTEIALNCDNNLITGIRISSDCLFPSLIGYAESLLTSYELNAPRPPISAALTDSERSILNDIFDFINEKGVRNV